MVCVKAPNDSESWQAKDQDLNIDLFFHLLLSFPLCHFLISNLPRFSSLHYFGSPQKLSRRSAAAARALAAAAAAHRSELSAARAAIARLEQSANAADSIAAQAVHEGREAKAEAKRVREGADEERARAVRQVADAAEGARSGMREGVSAVRAVTECGQ
jgi:hypothetical protein